MVNRILAVDDDQDTRFTLQAIGEVAGFDIVTAENGGQALEILQQSAFDLIMVDYHMPGMNGLTLVKRIRERLPYCPILVLTVDESLELARRFLDAGATDFAIKPIRAADLISRVKLHLELNQFKQPDDSLRNELQWELPKGMASVTLQIILDYMRQLDQPETLTAISNGTGLAYQTVHRYLDFLVQNDHVRVEMNYGKVGRPTQKYRLRSK